MQTRTKIAAIGLSAVALAGAVGVGVSYADPTSTPSPTASASASSSPTAQQGHQGKHGRRTLLQRALHGEVTVGGKQTRVIDFQRGTVTKISSSSITVQSRDDFTATYVITGDTRVREAGQPGKLTDLQTGDTVRVVAVKQGDTKTATVIGEPKP